MLTLSRNVTEAEVPGVVDVYTSGDFLDRAFNAQSGFFQGPLTILGWGAGNNFANVHSGTAGSSLLFDSDDFGYWIEDERTLANLDGGDSGGPLTFQRNGTTPTIFGVNSAASSEIEYWSPSWNNGEGNGSWIRGFIDDDDNDGVNDAVDNCNPDIVPACEYDVTLCTNPDQLDDDMDGIGDFCDLCPPAACLAQGRTTAACSDPQQGDGDDDGIGDVCDLCPALPRAFERTNDSDGDGVGNSCDTCPSFFSPFPACGRNGVQCTRGECQVNVGGGRCTSGVVGAFCENDLDCGTGGICDLSVVWFRCSELGDRDDDDIGDACDTCPDDANSDHRANSNIIDESREVASKIGDLCDPVPVFASRTVLTSAVVAPDATEFLSSAGIGNPSPGTPHEPFSATVGFRHCSCLQSGSVLPREQCLAVLCPPDPGQFALSDAVADWDRVTVGTNGPDEPGTFPLENQGLDLRITRTFTGSITRFALGTVRYQGDLEQPRIGELESLFWLQQVDIDAGRVPTFGDEKTAGFFWSHTILPTGGATASDRDAAFAGRLRNHYEYMQTPAFYIPFINPPTSSRCDFSLGACRPWWRLDWLIDPRVIGPVVLPPDSVFRPITISRLIRDAVTGQVISRGGIGQPSVDVSGSVSPVTRDLLSRVDVGWLTPEEPGHRAGTIPVNSSTPAQIMGVAVGVPWRQAAPLVPVFVTPNGLITGPELDEVPDPSIAGARPGAAVFVPGDREEAQALLSGVEGTVYLVGGLRNGTPTGEIWRYGLDNGIWERLFTEPVVRAIGGEVAGVPQVRPGKVLAAAYHNPTGKLVVLDEVEESRRPPATPLSGDDLDPDEQEDAHAFARHHHGSRAPRRMVRFLVFDVRTNRSRVALVVPRAGLADFFGLVARDDGRFVLVTAPPAPGRSRSRHHRHDSHRGRSTWTAYEFSVTNEDMLRHWRRTRGRGTVLDRPISLTDGVVVPVDRDGEHDLILLEPGMFRRWPAGCTML